MLAAHARVTWPMPAVAVRPLGVDGNAAEGEEPPPHAANASEDSVTMDALTPSVRDASASLTIIAVSPATVNGLDVTVSLLATPIAFIVRAIPGKYVSHPVISWITASPRLG